MSLQTARLQRTRLQHSRRSFAPARSSPVTHMASFVARAAGKQLVALDFDGVICDSCGESSLSAFKAAEELWPEIFSKPEVQQQRDDLVEKMRAVRPVVETGYENIVQIRCLLEGTTVEEMLDHWDTLLPQRVADWGLDRAEMVTLFGRVRDDWIAADVNGWLAPNRIYPGVADAVQHALDGHETYIVTTKQAHFTELLMKDMAGVAFPADRIYSQTVSGRPKSEVLEMLQERHPEACRKVFVEDKMSTLEKVAKMPELEGWDLFLVDWGYNTPAERARAAAHPRITVIDVPAFASILTGQ